MARPDSNEQVLQGTLDLLILKTLSLAPMHGWGLTHRIEQLSRDALQVGGSRDALTRGNRFSPPDRAETPAKSSNS